MFQSSQNPTMSAALAQAMLEALITVPGAALLATPKVHLYTAGPAPITPNAKISDFTEADFGGYAAVAITTWVGPINLLGIYGYGIFANANFVCTSSTGAGQQIAGYWVDNGEEVLYLAEAFAQPVPIVGAGSFLDLAVIFAVNPNLTTPT